MVVSVLLYGRHQTDAVFGGIAERVEDHLHGRLEVNEQVVLCQQPMNAIGGSIGFALAANLLSSLFQSKELLDFANMRLRSSSDNLAITQTRR